VELTAAKLISETANVDRFRSEAAFARYVGIAPVPMWSGSTEGRLRVSRSGNRQLNTALHRIAVVQIRLDCAGRDTADADAPKAIPVWQRCAVWKRRLCRIVYNRLRTDYARRQQFVATAVEPVTDVKSSVPAWMQSADLAVSLEVEDINDGIADDDELPQTDEKQ
jgi:transposase